MDALRHRLKLDGAPPYAAVTEWQARLSVHGHALVRLPVGADLQPYLSGSITRARSVEQAFASTSVGGVTRWGREVVAEVLMASGDGAADAKRARRTAGYMSKLVGYTTKDVGASGVSGSHFRGKLRVTAEGHVESVNRARRAAFALRAACRDSELAMDAGVPAWVLARIGRRIRAARVALAAVPGGTETYARLYLRPITSLEERLERASKALARNLSERPDDDARVDAAVAAVDRAELALTLALDPAVVDRHTLAPAMERPGELGYRGHAVRKSRTWTDRTLGDLSRQRQAYMAGSGVGGQQVSDAVWEVTRDGQPVNDEDEGWLRDRARIRTLRHRAVLSRLVGGRTEEWVVAMLMEELGGKLITADPSPG